MTTEYKSLPITQDESATFNSLSGDNFAAIYSYLTTRELATIAGVSRDQRLQSEQDGHWQQRDIMVNGRRLNKKSSVVLFDQLKQPYQIHGIGEDFFGDPCRIIVQGPLLQTSDHQNFLYCDVDDLFRILKQQPKLAYAIVNDPIFSELLFNQYPDQQQRHKIKDRAKKILGAFVGAIVNIFTMAIAIPLLATLFALTLILFFTPLLERFKPKFGFIALLPLAIVISFFKSIKVGYREGLASIDRIFSNTVATIFSSFFDPEGTYPSSDPDDGTDFSELFTYSKTPLDYINYDKVSIAHMADEYAETHPTAITTPISLPTQTAVHLASEQKAQPAVHSGLRLFDHPPLSTDRHDSQQAETLELGAEDVGRAGVSAAQ